MIGLPLSSRAARLDRLRRRAGALLVAGMVSSGAGSALVVAASAEGPATVAPTALSGWSWPSLFGPFALRSTPAGRTDAVLPAAALPQIDLRTCPAAFASVGPSVDSALSQSVDRVGTDASGVSSATTGVVGAVAPSAPRAPAPVINPDPTLPGTSGGALATGGLTAAEIQALQELYAAIQSSPASGPTPGASAGSVPPGSSGTGAGGGLGGLLDMTGGTCIPVGLGNFVDSGSSRRQAEALTLAEDQLGTPYVWGGESRSGFDCSGLVQWTFAAAGVSLPRGAQGQFDAGPRVPWGSTVVPGDLVFFGSGPDGVEHVGIVAGDGWMVDAPHTGAVVRFDRIAGFGDVVGVTSPGG